MQHFCPALTRSPGLSTGSFLVPNLFKSVYASLRLRLHSLPRQNKEQQESRIRLSINNTLLTKTRSCTLLTIGESVEGFAGDVKRCKSWALGLRGTPSSERCLQGRGPVTHYAQGLTLHRDHLTTLGTRSVGIWPRDYMTSKRNKRITKYYIIYIIGQYTIHNNQQIMARLNTGNMFLVMWLHVHIFKPWRTSIYKTH